MRKQIHLLVAFFAVTFAHCEKDIALIGMPENLESQAGQTMDNPQMTDNSEEEPVIGMPENLESQAGQTMDNPEEEPVIWINNESGCGEIVLLNEGVWELDSYGCSWYFITLQIKSSATSSIHCRVLDSSEMSCYGDGWSSTCWSAVDYTLYNESREFDLGGACCLNAGDVIHGLIACECTGTAYLCGHEGELINGTYDQSKVIFYYNAPPYTCPAF